jgi:exopolysaccharide production protein ExoZ
MTGGAQPRTIESIQHLRALAALGVVVFHALALLGDRLHVEVPHKELGAAGVDLFFVISGFIMWVTALDRDESPARFAWKRIVRIVPLYWLVTTFVLAVVLFAPRLMNSASREPAHFIASYLFVAWPHPSVDGRFWPPVIPGWTLNYEMFFYALCTASLFLRRSRRLVFLAVVLAGLPLLGAILTPGGIASFYTDRILLEFFYGLIIGAHFTAGRQQGTATSLALIVAGFVLLFSVGLAGNDQNRAAMWGFPLAMVVQGALHAPALVAGAAREASKLLGDASYSLYLAQFVVLPPSAMVMAKLVGGWPIAAAAPTFVFGLVMLAILGGIACYLFVERPILRFAQSRRATFRSNPAGAARP